MGRDSKQEYMDERRYVSNQTNLRQKLTELFVCVDPAVGSPLTLILSLRNGMSNFACIPT